MMIIIKGRDEMSEYWEEWQLNLLDDYILGYAAFNSQEELANEIGKSLNATKVKLSRRRNEVQESERELTFDEYKLFLSNRFDKTTKEIAELINSSELFLLNELDEIDSLESCEHFDEGYLERIPCLDEINIFIRLYRKGLNSFQIAHILNRHINKIQEMIKNYETFLPFNTSR
jgi:hypothetical protein